MANRVRVAVEARRLADWQIQHIGRELRIARIASGKRLVDVGRLAGISAAQVSRIERGRLRSVRFMQLAMIGAAVGLKVVVSAWPLIRRALDKPQLELFDRFLARVHPSWRWETEVPMPRAGDLRAADARGRIPGCAVMVELISRFSDFQAQTRSALLKKRDLGADRLLLVVYGTTTNRRALREAGSALRAQFPLDTRRVLLAMGEGLDPGADGIVLL
jgi:transcriptional regulator with XRE-family HTH domain